MRLAVGGSGDDSGEEPVMRPEVGGSGDVSVEGAS
jgi:hypothetical protein